MSVKRAKFKQQMRNNFRTSRTIIKGAVYVPKNKLVVSGARNIAAVLGITDRRLRQLMDDSRKDFDPRIKAAVWEQDGGLPGRPVLHARLSTLFSIRGERDRAPKGSKSKPPGALFKYVTQLQARDSQRRK